MENKRTPPPGEEEVPKCTAKAINTRSVPRASGLVQTALPEKWPPVLKMYDLPTPRQSEHEDDGK